MSITNIHIEDIDEPTKYLKGREINGVVVKTYITLDLYVRNIYGGVTTESFCDYIIDRILSYSKVKKVNYISLVNVEIMDNDDSDPRFRITIEAGIMSHNRSGDFLRNQYYIMNINKSDVKIHARDKKLEKIL